MTDREDNFSIGMGLPFTYGGQNDPPPAGVVAGSVPPGPEPPEPVAAPAPAAVPILADIVGNFSAWAGKVLATHDPAVDDHTNAYPTIQVQRVWFWYNDNGHTWAHEPTAETVPVKRAAPTPGVVTAWPMPPRADQGRYLVSAGDIVTVLSSQDGRHYYISDELPFVAEVISNVGILGSQNDPPGTPSFGDKWIVGASPTGAWAGQAGKIATWTDASPDAWVFTTNNNTEDNCGGAGLGFLSVRRQSLSHDAPADEAALNDHVDSDNLNVEYEHVRIVGPTNAQHGYRSGDLIWVERRGLYYFAVPSRETWLGYLVTTGPDSEAEPTNNTYWVQELDPTVTYTGDNAWTVTHDERTRTVDGSGGYSGRYVLAINLGEEDSAEHDLATVAPDAGPGTIVLVTTVADPSSGEPVNYFTQHALGASLWGKAAAIWHDDGEATANGCYVDVHPCTQLGTGEDTGTTHRVILPRNGRREDPNVQDDDVISYRRCRDGTYVNSSGCLDGKVDETVRIHLDSSNIPAGWSIFAEGKFLAGYSSTDGDYDVNDTGGYKMHSAAENGHTNHVHSSQASAGTDGIYANNDTTTPHVHSDTDNRPPFTTVVWIKRTS